MIRFGLGVLSLMLVLSGCVSVTPLGNTEPTEGKTTSAIKVSLKTTVFEGRFAVTYRLQGQGQDMREQGEFEWRIQHPVQRAANDTDTMQLLLKGPLGTTLAAIEQTLISSTASDVSPKPQRFSLRTAQSTAYADSLDELLERTLGWSLPLKTLLNLVQPNDTAVLEPQLDWRVNVASRYDNRAPKLITAQRLSPADQALSVRLMINEPGQE